MQLEEKGTCTFSPDCNIPLCGSGSFHDLKFFISRTILGPVCKGNYSTPADASMDIKHFQKKKKDKQLEKK